MRRAVLFFTLVAGLGALGLAGACTAPGAPTSDQPAASATGAPVVSHGGPVTDYISLVDNLRAAGATVEPAGEVSQTFFAVPGQAITVNGGTVQVFPYADEAAASAAAAGIAPDGGTIRLTPAAGGAARVVSISWVATPHFYRSGPLIVLYVGDDPAVTAVLTAVLGAQIAGR